MEAKVITVSKGQCSGDKGRIARAHGAVIELNKIKFTATSVSARFTSRNARLCFFANSIASSWVTVRKCLFAKPIDSRIAQKHKKGGEGGASKGLTF